MSTSTLHPLATAYLQQVRREGRDLPGDRLGLELRRPRRERNREPRRNHRTLIAEWL